MKRIISKRFLSMALAIIMIAALIPGSAFAAEGDVISSHVETYYLNYAALGKSANVNLSTVDDYGTHGWKFFGYTEGIKENDVSGKRVGIVAGDGTGRGLNFYMSKVEPQQSGTFALSLEAPAAEKKGFYIPSVSWYCSNKNIPLYWYISKPNEEKESVSDYAKDGEHVLYVKHTSAPTDAIANDSATKAIYVSGGEDLISAMKLTNKVYGFYSISLTQLLNPKMQITATAVEFDLADNDTTNDTATASVKVSGTTNDGTTETEIPYMEISDGFVEYVSSNTQVATVSDDGTITAIAPGTTTIYAQSIDGTVKSGEIEITVTGEDANEPETISGNVSFGAYSDVADSVTVTIDGEESDNVINSVAVGSIVKAVADITDPNYKFLGWKRGSRDFGVWLTTDTTVEFPIMTHTFLTAVYEPVNAGETVDIEFYNYNGQYLDTAENVGDTKFSLIGKPDATLTGYNTPFWTLDGINEIEADTIFKKLTRVVAKYAEKESFGVTIEDTIKGAEGDTYDYDTELALESVSGNAGTWYVNDKPVAYGADYKHYVWDVVSITFVEEETATPIISLDDTVKTNGARMIAYDANGKDIVEVGILFGENASVASCGSKATSKVNGEVYGQFTAKPNSGTTDPARGYLIYNDNGTYKVIYAD